jgi:hypothetical protein
MAWRLAALVIIIAITLVSSGVSDAGPDCDNMIASRYNVVYKVLANELADPLYNNVVRSRFDEGFCPKDKVIRVPGQLPQCPVEFFYSQLVKDVCDINRKYDEHSDELDREIKTLNEDIKGLSNRIDALRQRIDNQMRNGKAQ